MIKDYYKVDPAKARPDNEVQNLAARVEEDVFTRATTKVASFRSQDNALYLLVV